MNCMYLSHFIKIHILKEKNEMEIEKAAHRYISRMNKIPLYLLVYQRLLLLPYLQNDNPGTCESRDSMTPAGTILFTVPISFPTG